MPETLYRFVIQVKRLSMERGVASQSRNYVQELITIQEPLNPFA